MKKLTAIVIGAGGRGSAYSRHMHDSSDRFQIVGVAEPIQMRRMHIKQMFDIPAENCYTHYKDILAQPKMADVAIIATMDEMHLEPALMAIEKGYHLLLEKPVAQTPEECVAIAKAAEKKGVSVLVCHVLRYAPFYKTVKKALMDGLIGDVVSVLAVEGEFLLLADGKSRKVEHPKRKKRRHVLFVSAEESRLTDKIKSGEKITNSELRRALAVFREEVQPDQEG